MASGQLSTVVRHLHRFAGGAQPGDEGDAQLLERFTARRDEAAFAALVRRHGPMVLAVCRRVLGNAHDAEDAFQAVFLALVRKAGSIRRRAALGGWLHEVALRVALRARASAQRRRQHEQRVPDMPKRDFLVTVVWRDLQPVLDEEVQALPETCREAFVLCYLEGKTYDEAARQLDCPTGTLSRRLARARELLRLRLTRRGLVLPAGMLAVALSQQAAPAAVPAALIASTVKTALRSAAAVPARVAALAEGGLQAMATSKIKVALTLLLTAGLVYAGAAALAQPAPVGGRPTASRASGPGPAGAKQAPAAANSGGARAAQSGAPAKAETVITGQVSAGGKPVPGARVALVVHSKTGGRASPGIAPTRVLAETAADREGKFRLTAPGLSPQGYWTAHVLARAPGHGLGRAALKLEQPQVQQTLNLPAERLLKGRLVDLQGQPARGVKVEVSRIYGPDGQTPLGVDFDDSSPRGACWPEPAVSDAQGRFSLRNLALNEHVHLLAHGDSYSRQQFEVKVGAKPADEVTLAMPPARILEGAVTYRDTGKPVPGARLRVFSQKTRYDSGPLRVLHTRADANGRFRIAPYEGSFFSILAYPPPNEPYVLIRAEVEWTKADQIRREVNLSLRRGVLVHGLVTEAPAGKPVAGASVDFRPRYTKNPFFKDDVNPFFSGYQVIPVTGADGKFTLAVLPGPGHLLISGPTEDYVHREVVTRKLLGEGVRPNRRHYADGLVELNLKPETETHRVEVTLRRGVTLEGSVVGPDGKAVAAGSLVCRSYVASGHTLNPVSPLPVKEGRFRLPGWDPARPEPLYFLDAERGLGGVARVDPREAGKDLTVRLQQCGAAQIRFVDEEGRPLADLPVGVEFPISPGVSFFDRAAQQEYQLTADCAWLGSLDSRHPRDPRTDAQGRIELRNLIPGVRHWLVGTRPTGGMFRLPVEITAEAGKTLDLKDVTVPSK
jgi:RNA polymerase sigma factor (sigma-70 family)